MGRRCLRRASTTGIVWLERPVLCERKRDKVARLDAALTSGTRARQANARVSICEEMQGGAEKSASSSGGKRPRSILVSDLPASLKITTKAASTLLFLASLHCSETSALTTSVQRATLGSSPSTNINIFSSTSGLDVEASRLDTSSLFSEQNSFETKTQQRSLHSLTCSRRLGWLQQLVSNMDQPGVGAEEEERAKSVREATILKPWVLASYQVLQSIELMHGTVL